MYEKREISDSEKALVKDWNKRIESALSRVEKIFKRFEKNRILLSGKKPDDRNEKVRANLHFANMAALLPQVYAKDPEFSVTLTAAAPTDKEQQKLLRGFSMTAETVLTKFLVKDAELKKQAKKLLRSNYATSVGWWKGSWQENRKTDPLILNQIKDTQDNINRLQMLKEGLDDPDACVDHDLQIAELTQTLAGLETQQEISVARGIALDTVMSEDILIIDDSIRSVSDYKRAAAIGHRVWMTPDQFKARFGYEPKKAKSYKETDGIIAVTEGDKKSACLLCVWEIWSQEDNRIYYVCTGEEGFCEEPKSPDWTGKRWYPFFLCAFNEIDGSFYPISDIELTEELVDEYNDTRNDFARDRKMCLPLNVVREGGSLTDDDLQKLKNREGSDIVVVKGMPSTKLADDIFSGALGQINTANYDTAPSRNDMEMIVGGGDAARGTVLKAKTATEAEILSQGLRGRSSERQDVIEDVLNELGAYCLEMCLRKLDENEVKSVAGQDAVWPSLSIDEIFNLVNIEVRGGSTGKPDRLQDQDRWTKLLPVIEKTIGRVAELRAQGQEALAQAVIELTRETLRRFDERLDIEQFLPPPPEGQQDPAQLLQQMQTMKEQLQEAMKRAKEAEDKLAKGYVDAAASIATSADPMRAAVAFTSVLQQVTSQDMQEEAQEQQGLAAPQQEVQPPMDQPPPAAPVVSPEPAQIQ